MCSVISLLYYGLCLNGGSLAGNIFVNHALGGTVELAACFLSSWLLIKFGRRNVVVASLTLSAVSCLLSTVVIQLGGGSKSKLSLTNNVMDLSGDVIRILLLCAFQVVL